MESDNFKRELFEITFQKVKNEKIVFMEDLQQTYTLLSYNVSNVRLIDVVPIDNGSKFDVIIGFSISRSGQIKEHRLSARMNKSCSICPHWKLVYYGTYYI